MTTQSDSFARPTDSAISEAAIPENSDRSHSIWDHLGIAGSVFCLIHCVITTVALGALSTAGVGFLGEDFIHQFLAFPLLVIAFLAFLPGYRRHRNAAILGTGAGGIALLFVAIFAHTAAFGHALATGLTMAGSIMLVGAHVANWRHTGCTKGGGPSTIAADTPRQ